MSTEGVKVELQGIPEFRDAILGIAPKLRRRALRNALAAGARIIRNEAVSVRRRGTVDIDLGATRQYTRGTVAKAIRVRTSKNARRAGDVGVFVNVRPLPKGQRSRKNPVDPFYWRWIEFGTKFMRAMPFLQPAAAKLPVALAKFIKVIGPQIARLNSNPKDPL